MKNLLARFMGRGGRQAHRGFSLIELMIAMVLGLIVIAGVLSVFLAGQRSYRTNQALGGVQENARIAFEMLAHDIRNAGMTGCNNNGRMSNILNNGPNEDSNPDWWANWENALHGYPDKTGDDPASATLKVNQTDSIMMLSVGDIGVSVKGSKDGDKKNNSANFKLNESTTKLQDGDIIIVCDQDHAALLQISNYNASNVTVVHNTGGSQTPGNCSKGLGFPPSCDSVNGNQYSFGLNSQISKLTAFDWYIADNGGIKSLYRKEVSFTPSAISETSQEMVRNVEEMHLLYHSGNGFVEASGVTDWTKVDAVQMRLTLKSADKRAGTNGQALKRTFSATTTVRNRVQ